MIWFNPSAELPDSDGVVLLEYVIVTRKKNGEMVEGKVQASTGYHDGREWVAHATNRYFNTIRVLRWRPLPHPDTPQLLLPTPEYAGVLYQALQDYQRHKPGHGAIVTHLLTEVGSAV